MGTAGVTEKELRAKCGLSSGTYDEGPRGVSWSKFLMSTWKRLPSHSACLSHSILIKHVVYRSYVATHTSEPPEVVLAVNADPARVQACVNLDMCDLKASLVYKILQFLPGSFARDLDGLISRGRWELVCNPGMRVMRRTYPRMI